MIKLKIYLDTSVISAYFDFHKPLRQAITQKWFLNNAKEFEICISSLVVREINNNTDKELLTNMLNLLNSYSISVLELNENIYRLAEVYRKQVLPGEISDTVHIAAASYYGADAIVSWNFRHIVNLKTMKAIHEINIRENYPAIEILTLENIGGDKYGTL
ncbi:MAG: PIN domain-containing protein [Desulfobacterales bacterium]|nr:PIN domain-containing protein [Desulfobacterales bacterium]